MRPVTIRKSFTISAIVLLTLFILYILYCMKYSYAADDIECYYKKTGSLEKLSASDRRPTEKSIFFLETSCSSDKKGKVVIKPRQACAVESAARLNPNYEVYLLYVSPGMLIFEDTDSDRMLESLLMYDNVRIHHIDYEEYLEGSILEDFYKERKLDRSLYPMQHASDVLRFLTLWKYGGIYLDLDVVVIKSLEDLPLNFAGAESDKLIASSVISFDSSGIGHELAALCLKDLKANFNGGDWAQNGPQVITKLSRNICGTDNITAISEEVCLGGYRVHPTSAFNPVPWWQWDKYFARGSLAEVEELTKDSYVVHLWNKMSYARKVALEAEVPYAVFARKYCPTVLSQWHGYF